MRSFLRTLGFGGLAIGLTALMVPACGGSSGTGDLPPDDASTDETATEGGPDNDHPVCGNGFVEGSEQCDDGNMVTGDGCDNTCLFSCSTDMNCDDGNACNGVEKCADHKCSMGTAMSDGSACGTGKLCKGGLCIDASCGDGITTAPEECDDGNVTNGDGCDSCKFSCVSTDATRNCSGGDPCAGTSTCDDGTHKCKAGTPLADGTTCGTGKVCKTGTCVSAGCGDGTVTAPEQCDFGSGNGAGTGCEVDCTFSCSKTVDKCSDGEVCNGTETCKDVTVGGATGQKCAAGTPLADGTSCGTGKQCKAGVCTGIGSTCGNGVVETGEDCDFGAGNGPGTGCEAVTCKFSCTKTPTDSCNDGNACNGTETCNTVTVSGKTGQKCSPGTALAACAACGTGGVCVSGTCKSSICGDMCIDAAKSETCDPPATGTCDASCHKITAAVCGNGTRETGETCDDGAKVNLDGCDAACAFEQDHRANAIAIQRTTPTDKLCTVNALGGALSGTAQNQLNMSLTSGVKDGSINVLFKFLNLDDLTGTADSALMLGDVGGTVVAAPGGVTYDGTKALDWWYTAAASSIDATRTPLATLSGSIAAKALTAGPGTLNLMLSLGGTLSPVKMTGTKLKSTVGATSTPLTSTGNTPGHLASEHLDPALKSFDSMSNGELCGNISAASLAKAPAPSAITGGGTFTCNEGYTPASSLLDVIVGGCTVAIIPGVTATPKADQVDPAAPVAGAGGPYTFVATGSPPKVTGCKDKGGTSVDLTTCLNAAAYSSYFTFTTQRVIIK